MMQTILRAFLVLALLVVGISYVESGGLLEQFRIVLILGALVLALCVITIDLLIPKKSLQALSGLFFGLTVGLLITYGLTLVLNVLIPFFVPASVASVPEYRKTIERLTDSEGRVLFGPNGLPAIKETQTEVGEQEHPAITVVKFILGIICCYFCISFILQTKDDIRFVIPYVEFAKQLKGERPLILDTSVIIDGRIADICDTSIIDQKIIIPRFVLIELQAIADSSDKLKRIRGRRGLDVLHKLQTNKKVDVHVLDTLYPKVEAAESVDLKLLSLAEELNGRVATNDFNLSKVAQLRGIVIININDLANAMKPVVLPGESMSVKVIKPGEEPGQGVGYLDDGTMIVVEQGKNRIGETVTIAVTSVLQTSAGRMIFGRTEGAGYGNRHKSPRQADG
ncbi:MAG: TRAM domain-containing protein [Planctomycetota bacterium]